MQTNRQLKSKVFLDKKSNPLFLAREKLRLSQGEMAERLGISKNYVWMLENGRKSITSSIAKRIADQINPIAPPNPVRHSESIKLGYGLVSESSPGIMRSADHFERMLMARLDEILIRLDTLEKNQKK